MVKARFRDTTELKKGSWTPEEDNILIDHIRKHGHTNWRALPRHAGLLRCGKSCRLRWVNYLRPGIKRGNFTREEEETIINLHEMWGNRWSAIAARLPGRTDNEIKNVWHTHLKKRLPPHHTVQQSQDRKVASAEDNNNNNSNNEQNNNLIANNNNNVNDQDMLMNNNAEAPLGDDFWSELLSGSGEDNSDIGAAADLNSQFPFSGSSSVHYNMDFWEMDFYSTDDELPK